MNKRQGFTLIELLVVVLIIGILASVALPQYFKTVEKSRASEAISVLSSVASAQEREYMRSGSAYASSLADLDITVDRLKYFNPPAITVAGAISIQRNVAAPYYGAYQITLTLPASPGAGPKVWSCNGTGGATVCRTFLPS